MASAITSNSAYRNVKQIRTVHLVAVLLATALLIVYVRAERLKMITAMISLNAKTPLVWVINACLRTP
jgi:hypothetical protein